MARLAAHASAARTARPSPQKSEKPAQQEDADILPSRLAGLALSENDEHEDVPRKRTDPLRNVRQTPKRATKEKVIYTVDDDRNAWRERFSSEESADDLSDFIVSDSASEDELRRPPRAMRKEAPKTPRRLVRKKDLVANRERSQPLEAESDTRDESDRPADEDRASIQPLQARPINLQPWPVLDPFTQEPAESSPAKKEASPRKPSRELRFATPPTSPNKPRLRSPTKPAGARIPASPHRPSLDAFWSQDVINAWNDEYSPTKTPRTPRAPRSLDDSGSDDGGYGSPSEGRRRGSPAKSPAKTPGRDKEAAAARKAFDAQKHALATAFLAELDDTVTEGRLACLAASTGGVRIAWSRKLNSTAGRASWKRETIRARDAPTPRTSTASPSKAATSRPTKGEAAPPPPQSTVRHHACIELADKVISDAARLRNVLAHEFCHLATFMLDGVTDRPHGAAFRRWGARVEAAVANRHGHHEHAIRVTTRHDYAVAYKFAWACEQCGARFQRHSRSLDPARHRCGACRGALAQVRPPPRKGAAAAGGAGGAADGSSAGTGAGAVGPSRYQAFVKQHFAGVKREHADWSMGQVMAELARRYRREKEAGEAAASAPAGDAGVDRPDRGMVRAKRKSVVGGTTEEVEEVVVLDVDEGEGQVADDVEEATPVDVADLGLEALTLGGAAA